MPHPALSTFSDQAKKVLEHLHGEFSKLQTGRASASIVEHVQVESYGQRMELRTMASISIQDATSIVIQPWDKSVLGSIEKALQQANLGTNPVNDGVVIRITLPPMTEERRKQLTKVVSELAEASKIKIRQFRHEAHDIVKEEADEDERERGVKELQKLVDDANKKIEESTAKKSAEIMSV